MHNNNDSKTIKMKNILAYCSGDIYGGGAFTLVSVCFLKFLTDSALISSWIAGIMLIIGKIWDAIIDPYIGDLTDRVNSKHGKRRIFFIAGVFHITAAFALLWVPLGTETPELLKAIYYTIAYMLFATSFSLTMVPYHAFLPEITNDYKQRNKVVGIRAIFSNVSTLISGVVPLMLVGFLGWFGMGLTFGLFYAIPWVIVFIGTKKLQREEDVSLTESIIPSKSVFKEFVANAKTVLKNKSYRVMLGLYIGAYTAIDIFSAMIIYYVQYSLGYQNVSSPFGLKYTPLLTGIFIIAQILCIPLYVKISGKFGKKPAFMIGASIWILGLISTLFISAGDSDYLLMLSALVMGIGCSACSLIPWTMLPEVSDLETLISGQHHEGIYSGFMTFIRQLAQGVALFVVSEFLSIIGYIAPDVADTFATQTPGTLLGIKIFFAVAPIVLVSIAFLFANRYTINKTSYELIRNEITRLENGGSKDDVDPLTKKACEDATGIEYSKLYQK